MSRASSRVEDASPFVTERELSTPTPVVFPGPGPWGALDRWGPPLLIALGVLVRH